MHRQPWSKQGVIFNPSGSLPQWLNSHAAVPVAVPLGGDQYRVFFSGRDSSQRALIGYIEIDITAPEKVLTISQSPVVGLGEPGSFDDCGVHVGSVVVHQERQFLYYAGWNLGITVPFYANIGLAISDDGGCTFQKYSRSPILDRNSVDPFFTASPCVLIDNSVWRMWYPSCAEWIYENGKPKHRYHIKYAESKNGIQWERRGVVCIDFESDEEYAIARPYVIFDGHVYRMWYSFRGSSYRIGYAESEDGIRWQRMDNSVGIDVSEDGWDSEMIEYAFVFEHHDRTYMFYNGNGYGQTGIGYAVLDSTS